MTLERNDARMLRAQLKLIRTAADCLDEYLPEYDGIDKRGAILLASTHCLKLLTPVRKHGRKAPY